MKRNVMIIVVIALFAAAAAFTLKLTGNADRTGAGSLDNAADAGETVEAALNENGDIVIPLDQITETASFYTYNELDSKMEIIAVKASDGTIRTAFNTCQVCYSSGKGYYKLEDGLLTCQNCGNQFAMDQVEVTKGGCNPVPITDEYKVTDNEKVTIPKEFLEEAQVIFDNWKV